MRSDNRQTDALRSVSIERNFQPGADASILIKMGNTHVLCAVTIENKVPPFLKDSGKGWITAEYGMLPCATSSRFRREAASGRSGRTYEIQRLIGRSLRMMVDLSQLGEHTLRVDCDVLNADGGTRTASITGAALAIKDAINKMLAEGLISKKPELLPIAAISAGMINDTPMLDLDYSEDSSAQADANFVMSGDGRWIEIQSTAESVPFSNESFIDLCKLAQKGVYELLELWKD